MVGYIPGDGWCLGCRTMISRYIAGMDREHGASEACRSLRDLDFKPSAIAFDSAFDKS